MANIREREISEIDVQVALTSLLEQSDAVRGELLRSTKLLTDSGSAMFRLSGIQRSVFEGRSETDIVADLTCADGRRLRLLIEVKLEAQFMPRQGTRYKERVASALSRGSASHASSVLLAPATYFRTANAEVRQFDALIALETLVALAGNSCPSERELICEALDRIASGRPLGAPRIMARIW